MQISQQQTTTTALSATISDTSVKAPPPPPQRSEGGEGPSSYPQAVQQSGQSLPNETKEEILSKAQKLAESGASAEEVRDFASDEVQSKDAESDDSGSRSGRFVDTYS